MLAAARRPGEPRFRIAGPLLLRLIGLRNQAAAETIEMLYEFDRPFIMDDTACRSTFDIQPTDPGQAAAETVSYLATASPNSN